MHRRIPTLAAQTEAIGVDFRIIPGLTLQNLERGRNRLEADDLSGRHYMGKEPREVPMVSTGINHGVDAIKEPRLLDVVHHQ